MRIVIEQGPVKREIVGGFRICADLDSLRRIARQIEAQTGEAFTYGWIEITEPVDSGPPNNPPRPWAESAGSADLAEPAPPRTREELRAYEDEQAREREELIDAKAADLGCSPDLVAYIEGLERQIELIRRAR